MIDTLHEAPVPGAIGPAIVCSSGIYTDLLTADYYSGTTITNTIQSEAPEPPTSLTATASPQAIEFNWSLGTFWTLNGITELWEHTSSTPFASATKIWEGRGTRKVITKDDTTTRYYWVRMRTIGGQVSATEPASTGLSAAARLTVTTDITANAATDPVVSTTGSGTIGGPAGSYDSNIRTASYTNSTGATVTVQAEASVQAAIVTWDTAPPATRRVYYSYSSSSSGSGSADMLNPAPESLGDIPASAAVVTQIAVAAGDTLTFNLKGNVAHTDDVFISWTAAAVRLTGLKR